MNGRGGSSRIGLVPVVALVLLVAGVAADLLLVQPQIEHLRQLSAEKTRLQAKLSRLEGREIESRKLAGYFGGDTLSVALAELRETTPISYLAGIVEQARLRRRELGTLSTSNRQGLRGTHCFIRAHSNFQRIWRFLDLLESGSRLVVIETISIKPIAESAFLELRMNVSIYDPPEEF